MAGAKPVPVLYKNHGKPSKEAERILKASGIRYQPVLINDRDAVEVSIPQLLAIEGCFPSLEDIRWYVKTYAPKTRFA